MTFNPNTASWNIPTESLLRISGEVNLPYSGTISNIVRTKWNKITGSVFYDRQASIESKTVGNYYNTYDYFNTTGRKENNINFRYSTQSSPLSVIFGMNGQPSYYIPTRSAIRNIFACKFSSPGEKNTNARGAFDADSGEYCSNNSNNLRNKSVRTALNVDTTTAMNLNSTATYTTHKTNKNTQYIINSSFQIASKSDNGFAQHAIPYHIDQTKWLSSSLGRVQDYRALLVQYHRQTGSDYYFTSILPGTGSNLTQSWGSDYYSVYGYTTWNQLKASENSKVRLLKKNSYITLDKNDRSNNGKSAQVQPAWLLGTGSFDTSSEGVYLIKEPTVQFNNESVTYDIYDGNTKILSLTEDIFNDVFLNTEINNLNGVSVETSIPYISYIENIKNKRLIKTINKQLFPDPKYGGFSRTNSRENFIFPAWKDDIIINKSNTVIPNFQNSRGFTTKENIQTYFTGLSDYLTYSVWPLDFYYHSTSQDYAAVFDDVTIHLICGELMMGADRSQTKVSNTAYASYVGQLSFTESAGPTARSTYRGLTANTSGSLPWTAYISASSYPFANSNSIFTKDIKNKYKNYSNIPEFNISNFINSSSFSNLNTIIYDNSFMFTNTGSYTNLTSSITDKFANINQLVFDINTVVKLSPYKNLYPCEKVLDIVSILSKTFATSEYFNAVSVSDNSLTLGGIAALPFFAPGILFNSIKAGMPVNYTLISELVSIFPVIYNFETVDFENIFEPGKYIKNRKIYLEELTQSIDTKQYTNAIYNFLTEIRHTFCKNQSLHYFDSVDQDKFQIFTSGTSYSTDIEVTVGRTDKISSLSNLNWIGGVNYIGRKSFAKVASAEVYINQPIWYQDDNSSNFSQNGLSTTRLTFIPTETRKYTLDEILAGLTIEHRINKLTSSAASIMHDTNIINRGFSTALMKTVTSSFNIFNKEINAKTNEYKWSIASKWEFPFLAMTGAILNIEGDSGRIMDSSTGSHIGGLWHDFCDVPKADQGLFLTINDVIYYSGSSTIKSASLSDQVGFQKGIKKRIGELNESKEIGELLCIIPMDVKTNQFFKLSENNTLYTKNKSLFDKYIMPPKLDYTRNPVDPIIMFCTEITDIWSKRDLAYVWQNLLPQNGLSFKEKNSKYIVNDPEIINTLKNTEVKFMIFKCKMRSITNKDDVIGYNWPYDNCSVLELANINISTNEEKLT